MAEVDPRLDGRAFLQQPENPYTYVDGDDIRDPETGEVHPEFRAILDELGFTYGDISTSGTGVHVLYKDELPDILHDLRETGPPRNCRGRLNQLATTRLIQF